MPKIQGVDHSGLSIGIPAPWTDSTLPPKTLLCDNALYLVVDYPFLFSVIGNTYGGDGITDFRVPDMRGRTAGGMDNMAPAGSVQGSAGIVTAGSADFINGISGTENVSLVLSQLPSHDHGGGNHTHNIIGRAGNGIASPQQPRTASDNYSQTVATQGPSSTVVVSQGNNAPHSNLSPYRFFPYVIAYE